MTEFTTWKEIGRAWLLSAMLIAIFVALSAEQGIAESSEREINFSWEPIQGAVGYDLEFSLKDGSRFIPQSPVYKTDAATWKGKLAPGSYQFRLRAKDRRGVPGPWSEPTELPVGQIAVEVISPAPGAKILTELEETFKLKSTWKQMTGVKLYKLAITNTAGKSVSSVESTTDSAIIELPVAATYKLTIQSISDTGQDGQEMKSPVTFTLLGKAIDNPTATIKLSAIKDEVTWSRPKYSDSFKLSVSYAKPLKGAEKKKKKEKRAADKLNLNWQPLREEALYKDTKFSVDGKPFGFYRVMVVAQGNLRPSSKPLILEFEHKNPKAEKPEVPEPPSRHKHQGTLAYSYLPSVQFFHLDSGSLRTKLNILMLNSNRLAAGYWSSSHKIAAEGGIHRIYSELFGSKSRVDGSDGQKSIELSYWDVDLLGKYRWEFDSGFIGLELLAGASRRTIYSFLQTPVNTVGSEKSNIIEGIYGGRAFFRLGETTAGLKLILASVLSSDNFKLTDSNRTNFEVNFIRNIIPDQLLIDYGLRSDLSRYKFMSTSQAELQSMAIIVVGFQVSLTWLY